MTTKKLTLAAIFASLTCVATIYLCIPATYGYINLGDTIILIGSLFLGPTYSMLSAGIGSVLADVVLGYLSYAPATLIIKCTMGFLASFMIHKFRKKIPVVLLSYALAELIMIVFYTIYDAFLYGKSAIIATLPIDFCKSFVGLNKSFLASSIALRRL